jgi:ferredoxin-NADP reductase
MDSNAMEKFHWQIAQVQTVVQETPRVKTFTLQLPQWIPHLPGQHYDLRLTAEDGYQAQRSFSIASPPEKTGQIALTVELLKDGEVSTFLHEHIGPGDALEVRGPIGGYFVWRDEMKDLPLLLVAGGSGVVPLMAMLRHRAKIGAINPTAMLFSVRTGQDIIYQSELTQLVSQDASFNLYLTFTRQPPAGWQGYQRRIDQAMLTEVLNQLKARPACFVCGPTLLVEHVANTLVDIGLPDDLIRTERYGPTGT